MNDPESRELREYFIGEAKVYYGLSRNFNIGSWQSILSSEENARSTRMQNGQQRHTFIVSRLILRSILGDLLDLPPDQIRIQASPGKKPQLPGSTIDFSISHTQEAFLIGINPHGLIGVDMEIFTGGENLPGMVGFAFSEKECQYCDSGKDATKFLEIWTTKEAMLKLTGRGMVDDLKGFCTFSIDWSDIVAGKYCRHLFTSPAGETCCVVIRNRISG